MPLGEIFLLLILLLEKRLLVSGAECVKPGIICSDDCSEVILCVDVGEELITVVAETCSPGSLCDADASKCVAESQSSCAVHFPCSKPGLACNDDCSQVIFCNDVGGQLQGYVMEQCDENLFCNAKIGTCGPEMNSSCYYDDFVFKCTSRGFYPDPFDCHKYYVCGKNPGEGTYRPEDGDSQWDPRNTCPEGYAYDYVSTTCMSKDCKEPVMESCESNLQTASLNSHPSMYYICLKDQTVNKIYPMLYRCPGGEYNSSAFTCT